MKNIRIETNLLMRYVNKNLVLREIHIYIPERSFADILISDILLAPDLNFNYETSLSSASSISTSSAPLSSAVLFNGNVL